MLGDPSLIGADRDRLQRRQIEVRDPFIPAGQADETGVVAQDERAVAGQPDIALDDLDAEFEGGDVRRSSSLARSLVLQIWLYTSPGLQASGAVVERFSLNQ